MGTARTSGMHQGAASAWGMGRGLATDGGTAADIDHGVAMTAGVENGTDTGAGTTSDAYGAVVEQLLRRERFGMRPGLERTAWLLARLGNPQQRFPSIHVAGTNGKGATAAAIAAILQATGRRVGLFTSPHLASPCERVAIDGRPLPPDTFAQLGREVLQAAAALERAEPQLGPATQFELYTALGFLAFARAGVEVAVVEAGLGGRLDSTNVLQPVVSVITPIGLDHTEVLGPTLADIAREKAAILKPGSAWVIAPQPAEALGPIHTRLQEIGQPTAAAHAALVAAGVGPATVQKLGMTPLIWVNSPDEPNTAMVATTHTAAARGIAASSSGGSPVLGLQGSVWTVRCQQTSWQGTSFTLEPPLPEQPSTAMDATARAAAAAPPGAAAVPRPVARPSREVDGSASNLFTIPLAGRHQAVNGAVAAAAAWAWGVRSGVVTPLTLAQLQAGLERVRWPGRLETVAWQPRVVLDGAHNPAAAEVLAQALSDLRPERPLILVIGILAAKQWQQVLATLLPWADGLVATAPLHPRTPAVEPATLAQYAQRVLPHVAVEPRPLAAVTLAQRWAGATGTVMVCGSLYLVGDVRPAFVRDWRTFA